MSLVTDSKKSQSVNTDLALKLPPAPRGWYVAWTSGERYTVPYEYHNLLVNYEESEVKCIKTILREPTTFNYYGEKLNEHRIFKSWLIEICYLKNFKALNLEKVLNFWYNINIESKKKRNPDDLNLYLL